MSGHKHIERHIGRFIASRYGNVAEIGAGRNLDAARIIRDAGARIFCTDIRPAPEECDIRYVKDDIFSPDISLYEGLDLIYSIRPAEEMTGALISLAKAVDCDQLVYHLGFEGYGDGGEIIDCGVILHCYHRGQKPSKSVF